MTNLMRPGVFNDLVSVPPPTTPPSSSSVLKSSACFRPAGAVPVPVPGRAEFGEQPGGLEGPAVSGNQRISAAGTEPHHREPGVAHVDATLAQSGSRAAHSGAVAALRLG